MWLSRAYTRHPPTLPRYKLLHPTPAMASIWSAFATHVAHCADAAARTAVGETPAPPPQHAQRASAATGAPTNAGAPGGSPFDWDAFEKAQLNAVLCSQALGGMVSGRKRSLSGVGVGSEGKRPRVAARNAYDVAASSAMVCCVCVCCEIVMKSGVLLAAWI